MILTLTVNGDMTVAMRDVGEMLTKHIDDII